MNKYTIDLLMAQSSADLTIQDGDTTYMCYIDGSAKKDPSVPYEDQEVWRIVKTQKVVVEGKTKYLRQYPEGYDSFSFAASNALIYNYKYRL